MHTHEPQRGKLFVKRKKEQAKLLRRSNSGQVLLIVVLTMIVALTVGLSIAARTITNLKISKQNEESQRAFQAAEAGIEKIIESNSTAGVTESSLSNQSKFTTNTTSVNGKNFVFNGGDLIDQDAGVDVWLSDYPTYDNVLGSPPKPAANFTLFWGTESQTGCTKNDGDKVLPALEVLILTGDKSNPTLKKYLFEPCPGRTSGGDTLVTNGSTTIDGVVLKYSNTTSISVVNGLIMKVIPIYNSTKIGIVSSESLPDQGKLIESTGKSGDTVRKVQYFSSFPQIPLEIFPYSIVSQ